MIYRLGSLAFIGLLAVAPSACAHDTYFMPMPTGAYPDGVTLSLTSAEDFPVLSYGPTADRVSALTVNGPDTAATLTVTDRTETALRFHLSAGKAGSYLASVVLAPRELELSPDKVAEYLAEIGAGDEIRQLYYAQPEPRRWRETYTKYAKTVVCSLACGDRSAMERPLRLPLEFVADAGGAGRFTLLANGRPVPGHPVAITAENGHRHLVLTDTTGAIRIGRGDEGAVLLSTVMLRPRPNGGANFTSDFATFTFVAPKR